MQPPRDVLPLPAPARTVGRCRFDACGNAPGHAARAHLPIRGAAMRDRDAASLRALRVLLLLVVFAGLAACDEPLAAPAPQPPAPPPATPLPGVGGPRAAAICEAPHATVLVPAPATPGASARAVRVHYNRADGAYADWGLHVWQVDADGQYLADYPGVDWDAPLPRSGTDAYGAYFDIE